MFDDQGVIGLDISFYQGDPLQGYFVDFNKMKPQVDFVIIKVGQRNYADPAFAYNWAKAKEAGIPRGAYWFLDDERDGKFQAEFFWNLIKADPGEGPLVVDYEDGSGTSWQRVYDFLFTLQKLSGYPSHKLWLYTGYYYWIDNGPLFDYQREYFKQFPLWLASYLSLTTLAKVVSGEIKLSDAGILIPSPWKEAGITLWQIGTPVLGKAMGAVSYEIDYNVFNGGRDKLALYFGTATPTPDPEPEPIPVGGKMKFKVVWPKGITVRPVPSVASTPISTIAVDVVFDVVEELIADREAPADPGKKWIKLADGKFAAQTYPDSTGVSQPRAVKQSDPVPPPVVVEGSRAFSFKMAGYKLFTGVVEPE